MVSQGSFSVRFLFILGSIFFICYFLPNFLSFDSLMISESFCILGENVFPTLSFIFDFAYNIEVLFIYIYKVKIFFLI